MRSEKKPQQQYRFTDNERLNRWLNSLLQDIRDFSEINLDQIKRLTKVGAALSAEKNIDRILEMIIEEARNYTNADGGTLYITSDDEKSLYFAIVQNETLKVQMGGTGGKITWPPVSLENPDGTPNHANVSAYVALSGETVNIPDVYDADGFNFEGTRKFDANTGYRSKSMLVVPMQNHDNEIIGVLQLLNATDVEIGEVVPFSQESQKITESLASQAAVALTNTRLIYDLENLLDSTIRTIASAVDEKSPYTGGHIRRVAELTITIAKKIHEAMEGPFADIHFTQEQLNELRIAAWLHDVGKITTPEHVVDKATKLEGINDRIELIKARFEILKRDHEIELLKKGIVSKTLPDIPAGTEEERDSIETLGDDYNFLMSINVGGEFMSDDKIERLKKIAQRQYLLSGEPQPLLSENEIHNLSIRRGTLTDEERNIINNHVVITQKMLSQLPFPRKMRNVALYAATHHEKLDGSGYPNGLKGSELPIQSRIMAIADVFEALTSRDRPYKKGKTLSEVMKIMGFMVKDRHIDPDIFELFVKEKIYLEYALKEMSPRQVDKTDF